MEFWSDVLTSSITPYSHHSRAEVGQAVPGVYRWLGLCGGYALVMLFDADAASAARRSSLPWALPTDLAHLRGPWVWLLRLSVRHFHANPELAGLGFQPDHFVAAAGIGRALCRDLDARLRCRRWRAWREFSTTPPPPIRSRSSQRF